MMTRGGSGFTGLNPRALNLIFKSTSPRLRGRRVQSRGFSCAREGGELLFQSMGVQPRDFVLS